MYVVKTITQINKITYMKFLNLIVIFFGNFPLNFILNYDMNYKKNF